MTFYALFWILLRKNRYVKMIIKVLACQKESFTAQWIGKGVFRYAG